MDKKTKINLFNIFTTFSSISNAPNKPGIYAFFRKNDDCLLYIGESKNIHKRISDTNHEGVKFANQFPNYIRINTNSNFANDKIREDYEHKLIKKFKPLYEIEKENNYTKWFPDK